MKGVTDALSRLDGVKSIAIRLQENRVNVETDPGRPVLPKAIWKEVARVGFVPARMEVWAEGTFEAGAFVLEGARWPLEGPGPGAGRRRAHLGLVDGGEDPPRARFLD